MKGTAKLGLLLYNTYHTVTLQEGTKGGDAQNDVRTEKEGQAIEQEGKGDARNRPTDDNIVPGEEKEN